MKISQRTLDRLNDLWFVINMTAMEFNQTEIETIKLGMKHKNQPKFPRDLTTKINKIYNDKLNKQI
jgi:hypothetical protein